MIPTRDQCLRLFDRFGLPSNKKIHVEEVTRLALFFADKLSEKGEKINRNLVEAAGLLHDIDKNIKQLPGEQHPDTAVRVLKELGFIEVAEVVRKHSLHAILDPVLAPQTWEEKCVYLADKMTKYEVIGVEHRFKMWYAEKLPPDAVKKLDASFPKVRLLEKEMYEKAGISYADIVDHLKHQ